LGVSSTAGMNLSRRRGPANNGFVPLSPRMPGERKIMTDRVKIVSTAAVLLFVVGFLFSGHRYVPDFVSSRLRVTIHKRDFRVASWNIAAINNNPFEYWLTLENDYYDNLMEQVQEKMVNPGEADVRVDSVFTEKMFQQLVSDMKRSLPKSQSSAIKSTIKVWKNDFKSRQIISEFIKDGLLGKKRLASMPDRVTNTIPLVDGNFAYRPTVINCFPSSLDSVAEWWTKWRKFMFTDKINTVRSGETRPVDMLKIIPRAKYVLLSEEEENMSIPLQILSAALFDAILVHILTSLDATMASGEGATTWQSLRHGICHSLNLKKNDNIMNILGTKYIDLDVMFLQEVSSAFIDRAMASPISEVYHIIAPQHRSNSNQNSVVLLSRERFPKGITDDVTKLLKFKDPKLVAPGDVTVVHATDVFGVHFVLASFHGDTNGLATIPVVTAVSQLVHSSETLVFGLDANTYSSGIPGKTQDVTEFAKFYSNFGLDSCWGLVPDPENFTTFNARTYLQPQLNKASSKQEIRQKGDVNPKDFILFKRDTFEVQHVTKDNTGQKRYIENMPFPTLDFPSDHGILSTKLTLTSN